MGIINYSNMTNPQAFLAAPNTSTAGYFWVSILFMIIMVMFLSLINFGAEVAIMTALFIGLLAGIMLLYMGLINPIWLGAIIGALVLTFIVSYMKSPRNQ